MFYNVSKWYHNSDIEYICNVAYQYKNISFAK